MKIISNSRLKTRNKDIILFMFKQLLGGVAVFLALISYIPYLRDIFLGKTKPHAFSWLVWLIVTGIGFFIQISNGAGPGAWFNGLMVLICAVIMIFGFIKGKKEIVFIDWISLLLAFVAIYLWLVVKEPTFSMILVIIADLLGAIPTLRKSFIHPYSETYITYAINTLRVGVAVFALEKFSFLTASYHIYMILVNLSITSTILLRRKIIKLI